MIPSSAVYKFQYAQISLFAFGMTRLSCMLLTIFIPGSSENNAKLLYNTQLPQRPRGGQSGQEKRHDESFQARAEEPLDTDSHRTISKKSSECSLLDCPWVSEDDSTSASILHVNL